MAGRKPMKVVIIETVHVKTDLMSFKTVVQNLTGKESSSSSSCTVENRKRSPPPSVSGRFGGQSWLGGGAHGGAKHNCDGASSSHFPVLARERSFQEFERMVMELPPMEELSKFWDDEPGKKY